MAEIDNKYISEVIDNLVNTVGIKNSISKDLLFDLFNKNKIKECIKLIANYLGLPIEINLLYIAPGSNQNFESNQLVKTDRTGRGKEGITAQISIPGNLPIYGSSALINFPINVKISDNVKDFPSAFVGIMAHELSHILLHSMMHQYKDNEIYTDITAMLLGFNEIIEFGRKTEKVETRGRTMTTYTTKYGYLDDEQFYFAHSKIKSLYGSFRIKKEKILASIGKNKKVIKQTEKLYKIFKENFYWISERLKTIKIKGKDGSRFVQIQNFLFQNNDSFENNLSTKVKRLDNIHYMVMNKKIYNPNEDKEFKDWQLELLKILSDTKKEYNFLRDGIIVEIKYIKPTQKLLALISLVNL